VAGVPGARGVGAGRGPARGGARGRHRSAEAQVAAAAWNGPEVLAGCVSARELRARGFEEDVTLALEVDVSDRVPCRVDGGRLFVGRSRWRPAGRG
jgi:2-phosphosulfolactate phosphatase